MTRLALAIILSILPSYLRIVLMRARGAKIGNNCRLGFLAVIDARLIELGENVQIAPFNLLHRLAFLKLGRGSRMNGFNWVTGGGSGGLFIGKNSAITRLHFLEASGDILIDDNSIIAGRGSHFFTHGISSTNLDDVRSITIGAWCYVGSSSRFVPGSGVSRGTFVGMGSVVTKLHREEYVVIAGNPASVRKALSATDAYFVRPFLPHDHHLPNFDGR